MFRRRGCGIGCGGILIVCVVMSLIGWFLIIPRMSDALEDGVSDGLSTVIADEINPLYSREQLQQGAEVEFSFASINTDLNQTEADSQVDEIEITTSGQNIVIRASVSSQEFRMEFTPTVDSNGRLDMKPVNTDGWWEGKAADILGGGFEKSINQWLQANDLRLTDIRLNGDSVILVVTGN